MFNYLMQHGNRFDSYFQETLDLTRERFPNDEGLMTCPDQCYFFKWLMPIIKCKVNGKYLLLFLLIFVCIQYDYF